MLEGGLGPARGGAAGAATGSGLMSLGTGDGSTVAFALPATGRTGLLVFVAALPQPSSIYTLSRGTGPSGADQLVFDEAPVVGAAVEAFWVG